jgi:hypothetical protein
VSTFYITEGNTTVCFLIDLLGAVQNQLKIAWNNSQAVVATLADKQILKSSTDGA